MPIPDWQLPPGVDRGLWDYLHSEEMVGRYDDQMAGSPLAEYDIDFCKTAFERPGSILDLGCGTGRLGLSLAPEGFDYTGIDLSPEMLAKASEKAAIAGVAAKFLSGNIVDLKNVPDAAFDYAACLFSTLGMVGDNKNRESVIRSVARVLKPAGRFVLHVHNRYYIGLNGKGLSTGDITMSQAYGGAPLTLHHFSLGEARTLLERNGFRIEIVQSVGLNGELKFPKCFGFLRAYGYLMAAQKELPA